MGKKRVFELAKELGYQNNRDLIEKLQKLGVEVKSHSSTVDEETVRKLLKKADDEKKAKTDESRISRKVLRRRAKADEQGPSPAGGSLSRAEEPPPADDIEEPGDEIAETQILAEIEAPSEPAAGPSDPPAVEEPPAAEAPIAAAADGEAAEAVEAEGVEGDDGEPKKERREARTARPDRKREEAYDEEDEKPDVADMSISEFELAFAKAEEKDNTRVAPPPPSTTVKNKVEEEPKSKIVRIIDPNVLKARLERTKRPEPPKEWGRTLPAPTEIPAAPFKELEVRTDSSGKRKELVDVRKEAAKGKRTAGARKREEMSAKDLLEHKRGQVYYPAPNRKRVKTKKPVGKRGDSMQPTSAKKPIEIGDTITIAELSQAMSIKANEIISWLMRNGIMKTINQPLDHETAAMVCEQFDFEVDSVVFEEEDMLEGRSYETVKRELDVDSVPRAPVVTVMGHVDHGKTSLLDKIRHTNVAAGEAGGITQRIAGYQVPTSRGDVTFLDTPGHAAFTAMRARGAKTTDIVVLVVAADDGVMPQTREAIEHARAAKVPIIVAVNKIDKPEANPDRVLAQLADLGVQVEEWGGDTLCRKISAKTGDGVDDLVELIALQAEIMELRANPDAPAVGTVIEGHVHKGRGSVATVLVQEGTLEVGEIVVVGECIGKVRAMMTDGGRKVDRALPSMPVEILGLDGVPSPGDELRVAPSIDQAREIAAHRREKRRSLELAGQASVSLQDLFNRLKEGEQKELKVAIKADLQGSVEALRDALTALSTKKVRVNVISGGVGAVVESDVEFAKASEAIIIGFAVRPDTKALKAARAMDVDIRTYNIIYEAVDEVRLAMQGMLAPMKKEKYLGRAEVRATFNVPKVGTVAGCAVVDGVVTRSANIRLLRDSKPIYEGRLSSLKRFKDDVREVKEGFECGMGIDKFNDVKIGDVLEAYEIVETQAILDEPAGAQSEARP
jgi:translation initiation factor IF-2